MSSANKASNGRGSRVRSSPKPQTPTMKAFEMAPARQTVGFNVVNERVLFGATVLIGYKVEVLVESGVVYEGIFNTMEFDNKGFNVVLKYAKVVKEANGAAKDKEAVAERPIQSQLIYSSEIVHILAKDVRITTEDLGPEGGEFGFETDAAISRGRGGMVGRELQRWEPAEGEELDNYMFSMDHSDGGNWDQFAVNKAKFGVETTFDETLYTTKLDKTACPISEAEAERIAREIEGSGAYNNTHIAEERGKVVDDSGTMDEEDRYSSVLRPAPAPPVGYHDMPRQKPVPPPPGGENGRRSGAWGALGAGVAAVAGRSRPMDPMMGPPGGMVPPPPPPAPPAKSSAPIDIAPVDPRRELNRIRQSLAAPIAFKKDRSSPYGTPSKSPIASSPLIGDPKRIAALDLDVTCKSKASAAQEKDFAQWKAEEKKKYDLQQVDERKPLVKAPKDSNLPVSPASSTASAATPPDSRTPQEENGGESASKSQPKEPQGKEPAVIESQTKEPPSKDSPTKDNQTTPVKDTQDSSDEKKPVTPANQPPKIKSTLNPAAKSFSLRVEAKEFVPHVVAPPAAAPAAPVPAPVVPVAPPPAPVAPLPVAPPPPAPLQPPAPAAPSHSPHGGHGPHGSHSMKHEIHSKPEPPPQHLPSSAIMPTMHQPMPMQPGMPGPWMAQPYMGQPVVGPGMMPFHPPGQQHIVYGRPPMGGGGVPTMVPMMGPGMQAAYAPMQYMQMGPSMAGNRPFYATPGGYIPIAPQHLGPPMVSGPMQHMQHERHDNRMLPKGRGREPYRRENHHHDMGKQQDKRDD